MDIRSFTGQELKRRGLSPHRQGYGFLIDAVEMAYEKRTYYFPGISKRLYPDIARKQGVASACVEHSIRYSIRKASLSVTNSELILEIMNLFDIVNRPPK